MCNDDGQSGKILCKFSSFIIQKLRRGREVLLRVSSSKGKTGLAKKSQSEISRQDRCRLNNITEKERGRVYDGWKRYVEKQANKQNNVLQTKFIFEFDPWDIKSVEKVMKVILRT